MIRKRLEVLEPELYVSHEHRVDRALGGTRCPRSGSLQQRARDREPPGYRRFSFPHRRFHRDDVRGTPRVRVHTRRASHQTCTQELVRVLQRYVIYAIRRNDNGYLHGKHRERRIAAAPRRRRRHSIGGAQLKTFRIAKFVVIWQREKTKRFSDDAREKLCSRN